MIRYYLKIAWRNLVNNKAYSAINIIGLATGMGVAILIALWIWDEVSFDSHFKNHSRLAQVVLNQTYKGEIYTGSTIAMPLGEALENKHASDFKYISLASFNGSHQLIAGEKKLPVSGMWVQDDFPEMLTLNMQQGNRSALKDPSSLLVSRSIATALFGKEDPLNKVVRLNNKLDMKVAGVYEDFPHNTTFFNVKILLPWNNKENWMYGQTDWRNHCGQLFVQLNDHADFDKVTAGIKNITTPHIKEWVEEVMLHPLDKLHLYGEFKNGKAVGGRIQFVWLFGVIGVFVLLLACINFMNLSTARSAKRAKEIGIRKTAGSLRRQLIVQFLIESVVTAFISLILALLLAQLSFPVFNSLSDKKMSITWGNPYFWLLTLTFTLITGLIAGSYPAFYLSSFQPVKVLKGIYRAGRFAALPRKALVVVQFTVSVVLIIGTIVVFRQIQFAKNRSVGYSRDGLITVPINSADPIGQYNAIRNDLLQTGAVENMAESSQSTTNFNNNNSIEWRGKDPGLVAFFRDVNVTHDFGKTIGWTMKEGRDFSRDFPSDSASVVLNEAAAKIIGFKNPIGETIQYNDKSYTIIGVANNMVTRSPYEPIDAAVFFPYGWLGVTTIRINPRLSVEEALAKIAPVFKKHNPESSFEFSFIDEEYARKFSNEQKIGNLATVFAVLAIFISCLGLFGLSSFVAEQRAKEIGVRKVLGATVLNLWRLLSQDFATLVVISLCIASPIAYYFMNSWLQNYQYRDGISWWIFVATGMGALVITLLTVSFQAIKAAIANPIKSLKTE